MIAKETKQLNKAYNDRFNFLQKSFFVNKETGLVLFIEYLKYLRDFIVLSEYNKESEDSKVKIASIIAAIAEFDAYKQAHSNQQKSFHWSSFCELLKQNMEDWLKINDSV